MIMLLSLVPLFRVPLLVSMSSTLSVSLEMLVNLVLVGGMPPSLVQKASLILVGHLLLTTHLQNIDISDSIM